MWPDPDARFCCAEAIQLRMGPHGAEVWSGSDWIAAGARALGVLAAFEQPARAVDVIARLTPEGTGPDALMATITSIHRLVQAGALVPVAPDGSPAAIDSPASASDLDLHRALLADAARVEAFLSAVRLVVRPGDVVVDVGAGTGLLSVAAAQAGARVYAIEKAGVAAMPVCIPVARQHEWRTTPRLIDQWRARYGIDFSAFAAAESGAALRQMVSRADALGWGMAAPITMATRDLADVVSTAVDAVGVAGAARAGVVNGVALGFEAVLCEGRRLGSFDAAYPPPQSWDVPVWGMAEPVEVTAGQAMTVRYRLDAGGARPVITISCAS